VFAFGQVNSLIECYELRWLELEASVSWQLEKQIDYSLVGTFL